jgi:hypothetical protein
MSYIVAKLLPWNLVSNANVTGPTAHFRPQDFSLHTIKTGISCSVNYRYVKGLSTTASQHIIVYVKWRITLKVRKGASSLFKFASARRLTSITFCSYT